MRVACEPCSCLPAELHSEEVHISLEQMPLEEREVPVSQVVAEVERIHVAVVLAISERSAIDRGVRSSVIASSRDDQVSTTAETIPSFAKGRFDMWGVFESLSADHRVI